jgi:dynein assembly factor with WDR repeat domains 1
MAAFPASPPPSSLAGRRIDKIDTSELPQNFYLFKILRAHILPLTNCAFNKSGDRFITGSYDRTCKVWNTLTGEELLTLEGHKNVVYAIAFNNPFGDKVVTGSFDKTAKIWDSSTGELLQTLRGHTTEIVCLSFDPTGTSPTSGRSTRHRARTRSPLPTCVSSVPEPRERIPP